MNECDDDRSRDEGDSRLEELRRAMMASNRKKGVQQVRGVIERLVRDGSVVAQSDRTEHSIFPVAVSPKEAEAIRDWVSREGVAQMKGQIENLPHGLRPSGSRSFWGSTLSVC